MAHTIRAATLTGFVGLARSVGLAPLRMLDAAGIPRAALRNPDLRISAAAVRDLLEGCSEAAEDFALRMYDVRSPSDMGPVALVAREQPTVRAVLASLNRNLALHSDITRLHIDPAADGAEIVRIVQTWPTPGPERQTIELAMGQLMRVLRLHLGRTWQPLGVSLAHGPPKVMDTHHRVFGPNVAFHQSFNGVVCAPAVLDQPNPGADPEMARQIELYIAGLRGAADGGLPEQVRGLVLARLARGGCTAELAAQLLGVDLRTFQRQLAASGAGFLDIVQSVRMGLVPQYLEGDRSLAEVAELLGFSALSVFSRWHRTHYGQSASTHRTAARAAAGKPAPLR